MLALDCGRRTELYEQLWTPSKAAEGIVVVKTTIIRSRQRRSAEKLKGEDRQCVDDSRHITAVVGICSF